MEESPYGHRLTALQLAGVYGVVGIAWVLLTSQFSAAIAETTAGRARLQTLSAVVFVAVSALVIYLQMRDTRRQLAAATADLEDRIQQAHVLHRILRHNLRNKCNIIAGHAEALRTDGSGSAATIVQKTAEMIDLSEKSHLLRDVSLQESHTGAVDLVPIVEQVLADVEETYPTARIRADYPAEAEVYAHPKIDQAIRELIVNAVKHGGEPVDVQVTQETTDTLVRVSDRGNGLRELERTLLEEGFRETQTYHSKGLGLWVVRYLMQESDGTATIEQTDSEGTTVRLRFQPTSSAAIKQFLR